MGILLQFAVGVDNEKQYCRDGICVYRTWECHSNGTSFIGNCTIDAVCLDNI